MLKEIKEENTSNNFMHQNEIQSSKSKTGDITNALSIGELSNTLKTLHQTL